MPCQVQAVFKSIWMSRLTAFLCLIALSVFAGLPVPVSAQSSSSGFGLNVRAFGAAGDCMHDDTASLQRAVNAMDKHTLYIPSGCYLITAPITIPLISNWRIEGEGLAGTILRQQKDNTPIFVFTKEVTQKFSISSLTFQWSHQQSAANTNSVAILFAPDTGGHGGLFQFTIEHIFFDNGYRGISLGANTHGVPLWGFQIIDVVGGRNMAGATLSIAPSPSVGQPRCILQNIYSGQSISEPQVILRSCTSGTVENLEDNNGVDTSIDLSSNEALIVRSVHIEMHRMTRPGYPVIAAENSWLSIDGVSADFWSSVPGDFYLVSNVAGGGNIALNNVTFSGASPRDHRPGVTNHPNAKAYLIHLGGPVTVNNLAGINLLSGKMNRDDDAVTTEKLNGAGVRPGAPR